MDIQALVSELQDAIQGESLDLVAVANEIEVVRPLLDLLPAELSVIDRVEITLEGSSALSISGGASAAEWVVVPDMIVVTAVDMSLSIERGEGDSLSFGGVISGTSSIAGVETTLTAILDEVLILQGSVADLSLSALVSAFLSAVTLPPALPDISLGNVSLSLSPSTGDFSVSADSAEDWDFGLGGFIIDNTSLNFERRVEAGISSLSGSLSLEGRGPVNIAAGLSLDSLSLSIDFEQGGDLTIAGVLGTTLFDQAFEFSLTVVQGETDSYDFVWTADPALSLLQLGESSMAVSALQLSVTRSTDGTTSATDWVFTGSGELAIEAVFYSLGSLEVYATQEQKGLVFVAEEAQISVDLPLDAESDEAKLGFDIVAEHIAILKEDPVVGWYFEAEGALLIRGLSGLADDIIPDEMAITLHIDKRQARVTASPLIERVSWSLGEIALAGESYDLGDMAFSTTDFSLILSRTPALTLQLWFYLPETVNTIFGESAQFLNTEVGFEGGINLTSGLTLRMLTPIIAGETVEDNGVTWVHLDFGDFGEIRYVPPVFAYDAVTGDLRASGEFHQVRQLKIPLTFVQKLVEGAGGGDLVQLIPDALPLTEFKVLKNNELDFDSFVSRLQTISDKANLNIPVSSLAPMLQVLADRFNRLPEAFRSYMEIDVPDYFKFDLAVTPGTGFGLKFDIRAGDEDPVRFIYPSFFGPLPALTGITLRHIALGEILSGNLLLFELDAEIDIFDLPTLVALLALPTEYLKFLPDSTAIHRKFTIRDLFMIIVYQTVIPIPIPLFYTDLGLDILGLEGLGIGMKWQFPMPQGGLGSFVPLFSDMLPFFTEASATLSPDIFDQHDLGLNFSIEPAYMQLPDYLGASQLGERGQVLHLALSEAFARMLNALKTGSIAHILPVLPLELRLGLGEIGFGSINLEAAWAVTTAEEFNQLLVIGDAEALAFLTRLRSLNAEDQRALLVLASLGANPADTEAALILFLGDWDIEGLLALDLRFGLAQSPRGGAGFGFAFRGLIGSFLDFEARGLAIFSRDTVTANPQLPTEQLQQIEGLNQRIQVLEQELSITTAGFNRLQAEYHSVQIRIMPLQGQIAAWSSQIAVFEGLPSLSPASKWRQTAALRQQIATYEAQIAELYEQLETLRAQIAQLTDKMQMQRAEIIQQSQMIRHLQEQASSLQIREESPFRIEGHSHLRILDHTIFNGDVRIDQNELYMDGLVALFPESWPVAVGGSGRLQIYSDGRVYFHADASVTLQNFDLIGTALTITNRGVDVNGSWLGAEAAFAMRVDSDSFLLEGSVGYDLALNFSVGPLYEPHTGLKVVDRLDIDTQFAAALDLGIGSFGFRAGVSGSFRWQSYTLTLPAFTIHIAPSSIDALAQLIVSEIQGAASALLAGVFDNMTDWLRAGLDGLVTLTEALRPALEAARQWGEAAWNATAQWSAEAWQAAYQWTDSAWDATTQWSAAAWNATLQWGPAAWAATVRWGDAAWAATTKWGADAWDATTRWSEDTWRESATWGAHVWNNMANWSSEQWADFSNTLRDVLSTVHGDVALIPHVDTHFIPHGDVALIPHSDVSIAAHGDIALIPHGDVSFAAHGDIALIPHGDVSFAAHGDVALIPHGDVGFAAHIDTAVIPHVDTPSVGHVDTPRVLHGDISHIDVFGKGTPHLDTGGVLHGDASAILHGDTRFIPHGDSPGRVHMDTAAQAHIDTPQIAHVDTKAQAHIDTPQTAHVDTPPQVHVDTPQTAHVDTPETLHGDVPPQAHVDVN